MLFILLGALLVYASSSMMYEFLDILDKKDED